MKKLVNEIAFIVALVSVGTLDLFVAICADDWWAAVIGLGAAACAYFAAWLSYCSLRRYAKEIDETISSIDAQMRLHLSLLRMIFTNETSPDAPQPEHEEEHEDTGAPI